MTKRRVIVIEPTEEEREILERAAAKRVENFPGAKMRVGAFVLLAALAEARRELGEFRAESVT